MDRRGDIKRVTLMVCTYRRPEHFPRFVDSVARLKMPAGISFHLAVADNNPESHYDRYIGAALRDLPCDHSYGHDPQPGYANARNLALTLAQETEADLLAFSDDDMLLDPGWLEGHLRSHAEFDCDVVGGAIHGRGSASKHEHGRRFAHGEECSVQGAGNVSFRRWLIDEPGLSLTFDPAFNKTGREDQDFFARAHAAGARIIFSRWPVIHDPSMEGDNWLPELMNKADVSAIMLRNDIVKLRKEKGLPRAILSALWCTRFAAKYLMSQAGAAANTLTGREHAATLKRVSAHKNRRKFTEAFRGLSGDYVSRSDIRRG